MTFTERNQVALADPPIDINGTGSASVWISAANYDHITFLVAIGAHGGASTITVNKATDAAGTGSAAMAFNYRLTATTATDDFGAIVAATSAGVATDGATANIVYAIEIDAAELGDSEFAQLNLSTPGAVAMVISVLAIGSRGKVKALVGQTLLA